MPAAALRVALVGGVPALFGGGGLELQMARTADALRALGHDARPVHAWSPGDRIDVVHAFNHTGDVAHYVEHWRRTPAAFVLSPVLVVQPSHEWRTRVGRFLPIPTFPARALRDLIRKADVTVGLTRWEAAFMAALAGVEPDRVAVVPNGVDPVSQADTVPQLPDGPFIVTVGGISPRKRQVEVARALAGAGIAHIAIGGLDGVRAEEISAATAATGGAWLGEIHDPAVIRAIVARATAHVQLSEREGQSLAVLEALAAGTPVIGSDLPSHRELADDHPGWVHLADDPASVVAAARTVSTGQPPRGTPPQIGTWRDVAAALVDVYTAAGRREPRTGQDR